MAPISVCKYYLKGECRYGDRCKFDHPRNVARNDNRFATFQQSENSSRDGYGRGNGDGRSTPSQTPAFSLNRDLIIADLSTERPQWILSAYGPGSKAPAQLFGGPMREQSFEEMRLYHHKGVASGNPELAIQQANSLVQDAESQLQSALSNIDGAIDFIHRAENEHPNRNDICQASTKTSNSTGISTSNPFGANIIPPTQPATSFGQPSALVRKPNPFGAPQQAFGQPSIPGPIGAFGQPSALGQKPNPFASQPGAAALARGSGNPPGPFSAFAAKTSAFGTSTQLANTNLFGQTSETTQASSFGQRAPPMENPFAQNTLRPNPFAQPTSQAQPSPFASTGTSTPFGIPSPAAQRNPFGAASQPVNVNLSGPGVNQVAPSNPFGQSRPASPSPNPFGQPASTSAPNPFGQRPSSSSGLKPNPFTSSNQPSQAKVNGTTSQGPYGANAGFQHPPLQSYASKDGNQRLRMFKGKPVVYKEIEPGIQNRDGTWEKIWFPDGPPAYYGATELEDDAYTADIEQVYLKAREAGSFKNGIMPALPPKREWCLWDF